MRITSVINFQRLFFFSNIREKIKRKRLENTHLHVTFLCLFQENFSCPSLCRKLLYLKCFWTFAKLKFCINRKSDFSSKSQNQLNKIVSKRFVAKYKRKKNYIRLWTLKSFVTGAKLISVFDLMLPLATLRSYRCGETFMNINECKGKDNGNTTCWNRNQSFHNKRGGNTTTNIAAKKNRRMK